MNPYYPVFLNLKKQKVLVIGGGKVAERKVRSLLRCHARVHVVSPALTSGLEGLVQKKKISYKKKGFTTPDLNGIRLVICATNHAAMNLKASEEAERKGIICNVVDAPELCSFIVPSVIRRGDLTLAVSTGGSSPAMAKKIRKECEQHFGPDYGTFLTLLRRLRPEIQKVISSESRRSGIYQEILESRAHALIRAGRVGDAQKEIKKILERHSVPFSPGRTNR